MPHIKHLLATTALAVPLAFGTASADAANIVDTLKDSDQFSRFVEAIEAAELEETLEGEGPFTVFAPTNDAFDELPEGVRDALLEEDNRDTLEKLLKAHVIEGEELAASDLEDEDEQRARFEPMEGGELSIDASGDDVRVSFAGSDDDDDEEGSAREQQAVVVPPTGATGGTGATGTVGGTGGTGAAGGTAGTGPGGQSMAGSPGGTAGPATGGPGGQSMAGAPGGTGAADQPMTGGSAAGGSTAGGAGMAGQQPGTAGTAGTGAPSTAVVTTAPGAQEDEDGDDGERVGAREAKVVEADIEADNGVIHAIDAVLVPEDLQEDLRDLREEG